MREPIERPDQGDELIERTPSTAAGAPGTSSSGSSGSGV
jgi:hypothetical protein